MKTVIINPEAQQVTLINKVSVDKYYGITIGATRGYITREHFADGNFTVRCFEGLTEGNGWSKYNSPELITLLKGWINENKKVLEFETYQELISWLLNEI